MNGPRTNQFVAPTSFITSISRRRAKIERRIVFAMSSVEATSSTITAIRKTTSMTRADTARIRCAVFSPSRRRCSTPARAARLQARARSRVDVLARLLRRDLERVRSGFDGSSSTSSGSLLHARSSACSFETNDDVFTCGVARAADADVVDLRCSRRVRAQVVGAEVDLDEQLLLVVVASSESAHVPSAMKRPSRNIPISTVIVAAKVVERLAPSERIASETTHAEAAHSVAYPPRRSSRSSVAVLERDHALAHLVDHLAVVGDHEDRRARAVDPVEQLHDPDGRVGVEVAGRLVADRGAAGG